MMGYLPSMPSKAAHFVTDFTTVILNPVSRDQQETRHTEKEDTNEDPDVPRGPDTSSFTAFLVSLVSSSETASPSRESHHSNGQKQEKVLGQIMKENIGRKSLLSRGKQTLGKALNKAARLTGYRQSSESRVDTNDSDTVDGASATLEEHELNPVYFGGDASSSLIFAGDEDAPSLTLPEISEPSLLLSERLRGDLYVSLPALVQGKKWVLLYSTWRHGISLSTLYRRSMLCPGFTLLVVGDRKGAVFGGLVEAPLMPTNRKYQGTNSNFVFSNLSSRPVIYRSTGANHYYTLCSTDFLALGGGGHFALYLDGELLNGSSGTSETFGNSCLSHSKEFEVKEVELWGFAYSSQYNEIVDLCRIEKPGICRW